MGGLTRTPRGASRLVVALDVPALPEALDLARRLAGHVAWVKVGLELFVAAGPEAVAALRRLGLEVFLDLKLHDIPTTVARAAAAAARLGAGMLTLHCDAGLPALRGAADAARAAAKEAGLPPPLLLGVTVLTSWDEPGFRRQTGWPGTLAEAVLHRARLAAEAGLDGVVCAPADLPLLASAPDLAHLRRVCPGIRPAGAPAEDQARSAPAAAAVRSGAHWLVVGRPVRAAPDPVAAVRSLVAEIEEAEREGPGA